MTSSHPRRPTGRASRLAARARKSPSPLARPRRRKWLFRLALAAVIVVVAPIVWAMIARSLAPLSNTSLTRFDAIVVLGTPADSDGNPTPEMLGRVTESVHEYERGVAAHLILTGGAAHNHYVEARVMARTAEAQGIPEAAISVEPRAMDTIQNACYAMRIMKTRRWRSAEVVSNTSHLPRAALIFSRLPLEWRMHAVPRGPEPAIDTGAETALETLKTVRYLVWTRQVEGCAP